MCKEEIKKMFNQLSPSSGFLVGFIGAILILCTVGFFIFVCLMAKGNLSYVKVSGDEKAVQNVDTAAGQVAQPSKDELTGPVGNFKAVSSRDHVRGDAGAKVTLIEYSDFECPYCKNFQETMKQVMAAYPGKVKWIYRHYPLSFHANAQKEAEATECAYDLGGDKAFWSFADKVYERTTSNGTGFALTDLPKLAGEIGLNKGSFQKCLDDGKNKDLVTQSLAEGTAAGIQGTPGVIMIAANGEAKLIKGALPLELMKTLIDEALK